MWIIDSRTDSISFLIKMYKYDFQKTPSAHNSSFSEKPKYQTSFTIPITQDNQTEKTKTLIQNVTQTIVVQNTENDKNYCLSLERKMNEEKQQTVIVQNERDQQHISFNVYNETYHKQKSFTVHNETDQQRHTFTIHNETYNHPLDNKIIYSDGSEYIGQLVNGMREGKGIYIDSNKIVIYDGDWEKDMTHGQGKILVDTDIVYIGQFVNGVKTGKGMICSLNEDNIFYKGHFKEGEKDGYGEENFKDGSVYKGEYLKGKRNGKGKYYLLDGGYYEGEFRQDKLEGRVS